MTPYRATILTVEGEPQARRAVGSLFESEGYRIVEVESGTRALIEVSTHKPDLAIVGLVLPDIDGVQIIQRIRAWSSVPIIVLSAQTEERTKIKVLDAGAEDYVTIPFGNGELLARARVALRNSMRTAIGETSLRLGDVLVDFEKHQVSRGDEKIHLTAIEFRTLACLAKRLGMVVSHRDLLRQIWGPSKVDHNHYLRIYIKQLRDKLENIPIRPQHLLTSLGVGYRLVASRYDIAEHAGGRA